MVPEALGVLLEQREIESGSVSCWLDIQSKPQQDAARTNNMPHLPLCVQHVRHFERLPAGLPHTLYSTSSQSTDACLLLLVCSDQVVGNLVRLASGWLASTTCRSCRAQGRRPGQPTPDSRRTQAAAFLETCFGRAVRSLCRKLGATGGGETTR